MRTLLASTLAATLLVPATARAEVSPACRSAVEQALSGYAACQLTARSKDSKKPDAARLAGALEKCAATFNARFSAAVTRYGSANCASESVADFKAYLDDVVNAASAAAGGTALPDPDGALAACNADLATCTADVVGCGTNLSVCNSSLSTCTREKTTCSTAANGYFLAWQDCQSHLSQWQSALQSCSETLTNTEGSLTTCEAYLTACPPTPTPTPAPTPAPGWHVTHRFRWQPLDPVPYGPGYTVDLMLTLTGGSCIAYTQEAFASSTDTGIRWSRDLGWTFDGLTSPYGVPASWTMTDIDPPSFMGDCP